MIGGIEVDRIILRQAGIAVGFEAEEAVRTKLFEPYQVNSELMSLAAPDAVFMHCLPAHRGLEVRPEVLDGPQSVVLDQSENRMYVQKAILHTLFLVSMRSHLSHRIFFVGAQHCCALSWQPTIAREDL